MQKQNQQNQTDVTATFVITFFASVGLMITYAAFEILIGFTARFEDMQTRAAALTVLPFIIWVVANSGRLGRMLGDPD